ncbi:S1C family serine protease [Brevibacterium sp. GP-SGM9]|uniref:S1C family serine protease n=1 Tax=Brevibacterium sp. GP-SGM9 TaxID=3376990 RepID=UPI0039A6423A
MNESRQPRAAAPNEAAHAGRNLAEAVEGKGARHPRGRTVAKMAAGAAAALALTTGGLGGLPARAATPGAVSAAAATTQIPFSGQAVPGSSDGGTAGNGSGGSGNSGIDGNMPDTGSGQTDASPASAAESTGVVLIDTKLGYEDAAAAGTGIVLSKDGLVLTNNHVIADSTEISVTVATTGKTYEASVVGSDSTEDVAVLKLKDATDLSPAKVDEDSVAVGDDVTAVGNAEGGGELLAADGSVSDLGASVTTTAQGTEDSETLDGMIEVKADIVSGDSGGALLDGDGEVVGMNTAASSGSAEITGYAIPIETALETAESIVDGEQTSTNTLGYPAFLGIGVEQSDQSGQSASNGQSGSSEQNGNGPGYGQGSQLPGQQGSGSAGQYGGSSGGYGESTQPGSGSSTGDSRSASSGSATSGATVAGVYEDTPAAEAGLEAGDTITSIDSTAVTDGSQLSEVIGKHSPGDSVSVTWTDASGQSHTAKIKLIEGPAA